MPEARKELRLALGMRGGVSLAVWIGGACAEIDELVRADPDGALFWRKQLEHSRFDSVVVDVMAGASAGGLNGVVFASSIRHGFPMSRMRDIWKTVGDIGSLRRIQPPWTSVLCGDEKFLSQIQRNLSQLVNEAKTTPTRGEAFIDLRLSATLVEPVEITAIGPDDETLTRRRSAATFHFRREPDAPVPHDDFGEEPGAIQRLAVAARATASFPVAFEPAVVRSSRPRAFGEVLPLLDHSLVDCGGVFSERCSLRNDSDEAAGTDFIVADGGIVDNIPLGKAIEAITAAPAEGPTERYLLYLHPNGPAPVRQNSSGDEPLARIEERRTVVALAKGILAARVENESIEGDIAQLEAQRRAARLNRELRRQVRMAIRENSIHQVVADLLPGYRMQRAVAAAADLRRLLDDPMGFIGGDPFPEPPSGYDFDRSLDRWRAPLTAWRQEERNNLDAALALVGTPRGAADAGLFWIGLAPLVRVVTQCIEWIRALEEQDATSASLGPCKKRLYDLRFLLVSVLDHRRKLGWVVRAGVSPAEIVAPAWCEETVALLDRLLQVPTPLAEAIARGDHSSTATYMSALDAALGVLMHPVQPEEFDEMLLPDLLGETVDVRRIILKVIGKQVELVERSTGSLPRRHAAKLLDEVLRQERTPTGRLADLEVLGFAGFAAGSTGGQEIQFRRVSAAACTPLAAEFKQLRAATVAIERAAHPDAPPPGVPVTSPRVAGDFLSPNTKLAGNELSNFSAFFKPEWRDNDWMWGRLDAVPTLVDLLIPKASPSAEGARDRLVRGLTETRQREILAQHLGVGVDAVEKEIGTYRVGLEKLDESAVPGLGDTLDGLVQTAAYVAAGQAPDVVRRHLVYPLYRLLRVLVRPLIHQPKEGDDQPDEPRQRSDQQHRTARRTLQSILALGAAVLVMVVVFGIADSKIAVVGGLAAGLLFAPAPLMWIWWALHRPLPAKNGQDERTVSSGSARASTVQAAPAERCHGAASDAEVGHLPDDTRPSKAS